jgi:hypothetical protein
MAGIEPGPSGQRYADGPPHSRDLPAEGAATAERTAGFTGAGGLETDSGSPSTCTGQVVHSYSLPHKLLYRHKS